MSRQLPPQPNPEQLRKQAKDLLRACRSEDPEALALVQQHLPRLGNASEAQVQAAEVTLQEAQHVLAREYGCRDWNWLQAVVQTDFELLARLTDREIQTLLREVEYKDLVTALARTSDAVKTKILGNMSERVRGFIAEGVEFLGQVKAEVVREAQRRILTQLSRLAERGQVRWPDGGEASWVPHEFDQVASGSPRLVELLGRPLQQMTEDELVELWCEVAVQARREGILSLEPFLDGCVSPFLREGLRLACDGTEPALIAEILKTRSERVLLPQQETRGRMVLEGVTAILAGDHPEIIRHKLSAFFEAEDSLKGAGADRPSVAVLAERLRGLRLAGMTCNEVTALFVELAYVARAEGREALRPLLELADEPFRRGLQLICDQVEVGEAVKELETRLDEGLRQARARHRMAIAGIEALQLGKTPELVARLVREAAVSR